ncbi:MAG: methyl-accepting chemotaxis protein [Desulfarculales bacterium]|nr:methyl-accepting chemotaxis protein [Desulfarculales bacterium]
MRNIAISRRVSIFFVIMILFMAGMAVVFYYSATQLSVSGTVIATDMLMQDQKERIRDITHSTALGLANLVQGLNDEAQLKIITDFVETARFEQDKSGYFFVYRATVNTAHPTVKRLVGTDLGGTADKNGVYYVRELARQAAQGGGFVEFVFPKPQQGDQPKLGYAENIPGTAHWIGTGVYIDNVTAANGIISAEMNDVKDRHVALLLACISGFLLLGGVPLAYRLVISISRPLREITLIADAIAQGNLDVVIHPAGNDEITRLENAFALMRTNLSNIIEKLQDSCAGLARSADEIREGNQDLSERTQQQASAVEETASTLENLTNSVRQNAANSEQANSVSQQAVTMAKDGGHTLGRTVDAMQAVTESSKKINDIINVVNEIAFQTNLLALNAAVEAARAGEAGRGFAVVAGEVRNLAGKSARAAKEIQVLISDSVEKVEQGNQLVAESGHILNRIIDSVESVAVSIQDINAANAEQAAGLEEINHTMNRLDQAVQQNAALVEEVASASENLTSVSSTVLNQIQHFQVSGSGKQPALPPPR